MVKTRITKEGYSVYDVLYKDWQEAVNDSLQDAIGSSTDCYDHQYGSEIFIPEDNFDILEDKLLLYLSDTPGLYIFYFRPKKLWRLFLKLFKKKGA